MVTIGGYSRAWGRKGSKWIMSYFYNKPAKYVDDLSNGHVDHKGNSGWLY